VIWPLLPLSRFIWLSPLSWFLWLSSLSWYIWLSVLCLSFAGCHLYLDLFYFLFTLFSCTCCKFWAIGPKPTYLGLVLVGRKWGQTRVKVKGQKVGQIQVFVLFHFSWYYISRFLSENCCTDCSKYANSLSLLPPGRIFYRFWEKNNPKFGKKWKISKCSDLNKLFF
jgi:hypothetical protein